MGVDYVVVVFVQNARVGERCYYPIFIFLLFDVVGDCHTSLLDCLDVVVAYKCVVRVESSVEWILSLTVQRSSRLRLNHETSSQ